MARIMTLEQGKPLNEAKGEILKLAEACHFYGEEAVRVLGEIVPNDQNGYQSRYPRADRRGRCNHTELSRRTCWLETLRKPCCWLHNHHQAGRNYTLYRPAIAEKVAEAVIPAGVVNVVTGKGSLVGQALVEHPDVDKIAFTGSSAVGLHIQKSCPTVKRLSLELGGNCPLIITASADIDAAVKGQCAVPSAIWGRSALRLIVSMWRARSTRPFSKNSRLQPTH